MPQNWPLGEGSGGVKVKICPEVLHPLKCDYYQHWEPPSAQQDVALVHHAHLDHLAIAVAQLDCCVKVSKVPMSSSVMEDCEAPYSYLPILMCRSLLGPGHVACVL